MKDLTDWKAFDALTDEDIERAVAEDPDTWIPTEEEWAKAKIVWPPGKEPITIRIDKDILQWFRKRGRGYQSKINAVLRAYIEAQKPQRKSSARTAVKTRAGVKS